MILTEIEVKVIYKDKSWKTKVYPILSDSEGEVILSDLAIFWLNIEFKCRI
jgi:hypothetical protein